MSKSRRKALDVGWPEIVEIRQKAKRGRPLTVIAMEHGLDRSYVWRVVNGLNRREPPESPRIDDLSIQKMPEIKLCSGCGNPMSIKCGDGRCIECNVRRLAQQGLVQIQEGAA